MRPSRRSRLAAPFVITVAAATGCAPEAQAPHRNPPPEPHFNPPPQEPERPVAQVLPPEPPHVNPPPPPHPVMPELPLPTNPANVQKEPDGSCREYTHVQCPPGVMCNPPPPHPVRCP